jgi:hypothetical protein
MRALSIKQPWAWLICAGYKDVENRKFDAPRCGRIYVHASRKVDDEGAIWLWENKERLGIQGCINDWTVICNTWKQGAIIGEVDIEYVTLRHSSLWFTGPLGYVLRNPELYDKPIPCKGKLGFFEPEIPIREKVNHRVY